MSDHHDEYHSHGKLYLSVFFALCGFTGISIVADLVHIPNRAMLIGIVLSVAVCKALCVMLIFMHLKFEGNWKFIVLLPTTILAIGLIFALAPDIGLHYYQPDVPQVTQPAPASPAADHHDTHGHGH